MPEKSFGAALLYFTGSKEVSMEMRKMSIKRGLKLEYGLFNGATMVAGQNEEEIFLGTRFITWNQNLGRMLRMWVAIQRELPLIIGYHDIRGDLHMHTDWSDGKSSLKDMVEKQHRIKSWYIAITDHIGSLQVPKGIDEIK